jgi:hypothetical protein
VPRRQNFSASTPGTPSDGELGEADATALELNSLTLFLLRFRRSRITITVAFAEAPEWFH